MTTASYAKGDDIAPTKNISLFSGIVLVIATVVGGGMFSLPTVMSGIWFSWASIVLVFFAVVMMMTGLMLAEVNLHFPTGASFDTFTRELMGKGWSIVVGISLGFVLYILTYAYISGSSSVLSKTLADYTSFNLPNKISVIVVTLIVGSIILISSVAVSRVTAILLVGKFLAFFMTFSGMMLHVEVGKLFYMGAEGESYLQYIFVAFPFVILSYGFHGNVPSIVKLFGRNQPKKIVGSIIYGTLFGLILYVVWLVVTMGNIGRDNFGAIIAGGGNIDVFVSAMGDVGSSKSMKLILTFFGNFAVASSLFAATLGLFDYIADLCKFGNDTMGRLKTAVVTYLPPALFCFFYPDGFLKAIGYAGIAFTIWSVILPPLLVMKARKRFPTAIYRAPCNNAALWAIFFIGILVYITVFLDIFGVLPKYI